MADTGKGGGVTPFESMSHEEMLAWLDQADAAAVVAAAAKLKKVAAEVQKAGEELKTRPQWVSWKGEGADAFREWSGDLANATLRLAEYSAGAAKWLDQAAHTIANVKASIPRDTKNGQSLLTTAQANLAAAKAAPKDPDSASTVRDSNRDIQAVLGQREADRLQAAQHMRKLGQSYTLSAQQMDSLEKPKFPPPPTALTPPDRMPSEDLERSGNASGVAVTRTAGQGLAAGRADSAPSRGTGTGGSAGSPETAATAPEAPTGGAVRPQPPTGMEIDSVATLPEAPTAPPGPTSGPPMAGGRPEGTTTMPPGAVPPVTGSVQRPTVPPTGPGRPSPGLRPPVAPGQTPLGTGPSAQRPAAGGGVTGGRPVSPSPGRASGGIPRGTVIGGEGVTGRGPATQPVGPGRPGAVQGGSGSGRRVVGQPEGIVGGRPQGARAVNARPISAGGSTMARGTAPSAPGGGTGGRRSAPETGGIVGGRPQQPGTGSARSFTPGGSGLVRGAVAGGSGRPAGPATQGGTRGAPSVSGVVQRTGEPQHGAGSVGRGGAVVPPGSRSMESRREDRRGERPDYLTEDEETWQQGARRATPPVID